MANSIDRLRELEGKRTKGLLEQHDTAGYNDTELRVGEHVVAKVRNGDFDGPFIRFLWNAYTNGELVPAGERDGLVEALKVADAAINPPDRGGLSLDKWNERLKAATAQIRAALAQTEEKRG